MCMSVWSKKKYTLLVFLLPCCNNITLLNCTKANEHIQKKNKKLSFVWVKNIKRILNLKKKGTQQNVASGCNHQFNAKKNCLKAIACLCSKIVRNWVDDHQKENSFNLSGNIPVTKVNVIVTWNQHTFLLFTKYL